MSGTVLLTGATGFLGSHLLEALLKQGYDVTILKRSSSDTWRIDHLLPNIRTYDIDLVDYAHVFSERKIETIIHLATLYIKLDSDSNIRSLIDSNVIFPAQLLESALKYGVRNFVNTGTFFEYDPVDIPLSETSAIKPVNLYAKTKTAFEALLQTYSSKLSIVTLRLFSPYGPKDNNKIVPYVLKSLIEKNKVELSEGLQKLDFIYCSDVVSAFIKALGYMDSKSNGYEVFNIGTGFPYSVREIVSIIEEESNESLQKVWGRAEALDFSLIYADNSKAKKYLDWQPEVSLREGLQRTLNYYRGEDES